MIIIFSSRPTSTHANGRDVRMMFQFLLFQQRLRPTFMSEFKANTLRLLLWFVQLSIVDFGSAGRTVSKEYVLEAMFLEEGVMMNQKFGNVRPRPGRPGIKSRLR
jgi:hypothetical protein